MMLWRRLQPSLIAILSGWACIGLFALLAGLALVEDGSRYATQVNLLLFLPGLPLVLMASRWSELGRQPIFWLLLVFFVWVLGSVLLNPGGPISLGRWFKVCLQISVFLLLIPILQNRTLWLGRTLILAVMVAMLCAWLSLYQSYWVQGVSLAYRVYRLEASGIWGLADFGNAILAALFYATMVILAVGLWPRIHKAWRLPWLLGLCGLCMAVFATYSRGVWVALALAFLCYWSLALSRRQFVGMLALCGVGGLLALLVAPAMLAKVFLNLSYREEIWQYTLDQLGGNWIFGLGPEASFNACVEALQRCFNQAHSLYLQILYDFGLIGLLILGGLLVSVLQVARGNRHCANVRMALPLLVFALVAGVASYSALFTRPDLVWVFFWLPVGMLLGVGSARSDRGGA
ncbi:MAG: O-antigen ligase domain-containing protein [Aquipseudomonas alcaligenes]|uniref:O-antigen ligase domain-containing protein n=1 Tax=Aquipseudomonas alcaligenes TaxID=43263 RepID=A0A5C7VTF5_AQUAC|nr:MAG: O-antigen ligase domain-containing protein [Pseudomonas alcaligenes]